PGSPQADSDNAAPAGSAARGPTGGGGRHRAQRRGSPGSRRVGVRVKRVELAPPAQALKHGNALRGALTISPNTTRLWRRSKGKQVANWNASLVAKRTDRLHQRGLREFAELRVDRPQDRVGVHDGLVRRQGDHLLGASAGRKSVVPPPTRTCLAG